jgi:hypothetical protein
MLRCVNLSVGRMIFRLWRVSTDETALYGVEPHHIEYLELKVHPVNENVVEKDALTTYLELRMHHTGALTLVIQNVTWGIERVASVVNRSSASINGGTAGIGPPCGGAR